MPKVYLSSEARERAREERELDLLSERIRTCKGRTRRNDEDTAKLAGMCRTTFCNLKQPGRVENLSLLSARRLAHAVGCTADDWLRIGGFTK